MAMALDALLAFEELFPALRIGRSDQRQRCTTGGCSGRYTRTPRRMIDLQLVDRHRLINIWVRQRYAGRMLPSYTAVRAVGCDDLGGSTTPPAFAG
jgi:hypothetical protein